MTAAVPALRGIDPLIAEAKERAKRRRLLVLAAAGLIAAGLLAFELAPSGAGGGARGTIPWLPAKPNIGAANPPLAPPCTASQLRAGMSLGPMSGGMWGGLIGLVNRSSSTCALVGRAQLWLGSRRATKYGPNAGLPHPLFDPLAPPDGSLRALAPGRHVAVALWLQPEALGACASKALPVVLTAPGGGNIRLAPFQPSCYSDYIAQATRYTPVSPAGLRNSKLPLSARIVSTGPPWRNGHGKPETDDGPYVVAHPGSWLSFTVVLTNRSAHTYRFGRTCPAYEEGFRVINTFLGSQESQAYVLNCHPVGPIAPHASVRFAMRVHVPKEDISSLLWTLAPHTYRAPQALAWVS